MNPLQALMQACSKLHDADGRVAVPEFYDSVRSPEPWEREELAKLPTSEDDYAKFLGISAFHPPPGFHLWRQFVFVQRSNSMGLGVAIREKVRRR